MGHCLESAHGLSVIIYKHFVLSGFAMTLPYQIMIKAFARPPPPPREGWRRNWISYSAPDITFGWQYENVPQDRQIINNIVNQEVPISNERRQRQGLGPIFADNNFDLVWENDVETWYPVLRMGVGDPTNVARWNHLHAYYARQGYHSSWMPGYQREQSTHLQMQLTRQRRDAQVYLRENLPIIAAETPPMRKSRSLIMGSQDRNQEGIPLLAYPISTWNGRWVHGWVLETQSNESRRFVGRVSFGSVIPSDDPAVTVTVYWIEGRGFLPNPMIRIVRASLLATK